jgi:hypothetical protein
MSGSIFIFFSPVDVISMNTALDLELGFMNSTAFCLGACVVPSFLMLEAVNLFRCYFTLIYNLILTT